MKFDVPMIWRRPFCHTKDCYVCLTKVTGFSNNTKVVYANVPSVSLPVPHSDAVAYPICPGSENKRKSLSSSSEKSSGNEFMVENKPKILSQAQLNDWVRDLELTKQKSELHASRMQQFNFVAPDVKVTYYRNRHQPFARHYKGRQYMLLQRYPCFIQ